MRQFTLERTTFIILIFLLIAIATRAPADTDTWWHLRSGAYTLSAGMIHTDPFSHTYLGEPWINHSWGSQFFLYGAYQLLGNAGLAVFQTILAVGGLLLLYPICAGNIYLRSFALIAGATAASVFWAARPQMFSFFGNGLIMLLLYDYKHHGRDRLWLIPLIMLVWGNLHAGYSIGFIFLGAAIVGETLNMLTGNPAIGWRGIGKLVAVTLLAGVALLVNPYGLAMLLVPFQTVGIDSLRQFIQEWNSPNFQWRETWAFIGLVVALLGAAWGSRLRFDWTGFLLLGGTLFMALLYGRNIAVFAVAAAPLLTHHLDSLLEARGWRLTTRRSITPRQGRLNLALTTLIALGVLAYTLNVVAPTTTRDVQKRLLPVEAVEYLNTAQPDGKLFNSYNWGGYLLFAAPAYPVFIDGRTDLYGAFLQVYFDTAIAAGDWRGTLADYDIGVVLVEATSGLADALRREPGWTLAYEDDLAVVFTRG